MSDDDRAPRANEVRETQRSIHEVGRDATGVHGSGTIDLIAEGDDWRAAIGVSIEAKDTDDAAAIAHLFRESLERGLTARKGDPIYALSDGPRLALADGSVVAPIITDRDTGRELMFVGGDQGSYVHADETPPADNVKVDVAFVDDPEAEEYVERVREQRRVQRAEGDGGDGE